MSEHHRSILKSSTGIAAATTMCRILGLVREVLIARFLGGGAVATAWQLAFMVPNLFRRVLGEGALGSALMPLLSHSIEREGKTVAVKKLASILAILGILLALISVVIAAGSMIAAPFARIERVHLTFKLLPLLAPYAFFICLVGVIGSALNCVRVFFIPALGALSLNIFMILCLLFVCPVFLGKNFEMLSALSVSVILSGIAQLALMVWLIKRAGLLPPLSLSGLWNSQALSELWRLTLPGLLGASALQISFVADRTIACWIGDEAVPALSYSDRIVDIPIGIFAVSFGSVALSSLSSAAAKGKREEFVSTLIFSLRHIMFLCVPMAVFTAFFSREIIRLFFLGGAFTESNLNETAWALLFFSFGIPFFCAIKITLAGFYSQKDMKTPLYVSLGCILVNIALNLILMWPLRQGGIALATVISSVLNNSILLYILRRRMGPLHLRELLRSSLLCLTVSVVTAGLLRIFYDRLAFFHFQRFPDLVPLAVAGAVFVTVSLAALYALKCKEVPELLGILSRRRR